MILQDVETGEIYKGIIEEVTTSELKKLRGNKNFTFDWSKEVNAKVYKITVKHRKEILGLISLVGISRELRIHINLIESNKLHRGKDKKIKNIPGSLISYACKIAFEQGYDGFVSLVPKTELVDYYRSYGFVELGNQMAIFLESSRLLILKYIGDEEI